MTYPDRSVQQFLSAHFVFMQIDVSKRDPSLNDLFREVKPFWAPLFRATSSRGTELRRWFGFLPPPELIVELELVLAHDLLLQRNESAARDRLAGALQRHPESPAAPELTFWMGVAAFKAADRDFDALDRIWGSLIAQWPQSTWAKRADVMEMRNRDGECGWLAK